MAVRGQAATALEAWRHGKALAPGDQGEGSAHGGDPPLGTAGASDEDTQKSAVTLVRLALDSLGSTSALSRAGSAPSLCQAAVLATSIAESTRCSIPPHADDCGMSHGGTYRP